MSTRFAATKAAVLRSAGSAVTVITDYPVLPTQFVHIRSLAAAQALAADPRVVSLQADTEMQPDLAQSLPLIRQPEVAAAGDVGEGTAVAVLDTGVDYTRTAFGSCKTAGSSCSVVYEQDIAPDDHKRDADGHGTNVAGIVLGVAPKVKVVALDVFGKKGAATTDILKGITWVVAHQADYHIAAMNLSLGDNSHHTTECGASDYAGPFASAASVGVIPVDSTGNDAYVNGKYTSGVNEPACAPGTLRVGSVYDSNVGSFKDTEKGHTCTDSTTAADLISCFSQGGSLVGLYAPGAKITAAGSTYAGTSQAAPHVSGAIAVLRAAFPSASVADIAASLGHSTVGLTDPREDSSNGFLVFPRLDLKAAFDALTMLLNDKSISDGTVRLGVGPYGDLNAPDSEGVVTGLHYLPTGADALSPGCLCEGWGIADNTSGEFGYTDEAQGTSNLTALTYTRSSTRVSVSVRVGSSLEVNHDYHPSAVAGVYEVTVNIKNITDQPTGDITYRRVMDWDVPPTPFDEFVTLQGATTPGVKYLSDDGFASANPLAGPSSILAQGDVVDSGPEDHGALVDLSLGTLSPGASTSIKLYYGAAGNESDALSALATLGATAYSLAEPNTSDGPTLGLPNTFIFGYRSS